MRLGWVIVCVVGLGVLAGASGVSPRDREMPELRVPEASALRDAVLHRVIDGDSVEVFFEGRVERLELSGIDAPDVREGHPDQRGAAQGREVLELLASGETLKVLLDPRRPRDAAGRLKGYLYRAPELTLLNLELVRMGLAKHPNDPGGWNERVFVWAHEQARGARKGLWDPSFGVAQEPEISGVTEAAASLKRAEPEALAEAAAAPGPERSHADENAAGAAEVVYVTRSGTKYHREGCRHASSSGTAVRRDELDPDLEPCKVCDPDGDG